MRWFAGDFVGGGTPWTKVSRMLCVAQKCSDLPWWMIFCRFVYLFILICISVHIDLYTSFGGNSFFFCGAVAG